jgi:GNAT superfamily N-acetyltransferase
MHVAEPGIIAKENNEVVAYVLAMTPSFRTGFPVLEPLFKLFEKIPYEGKPVSAYHYLVVGQACIDKKYRGKGILKKLYAAYTSRFRGKYDFAITEIATKNLRSMNAHQRIGFKPVHEYTGPDGVQWTIVILDWKKSPSPAG